MTADEEEKFIFDLELYYSDLPELTSQFTPRHQASTAKLEVDTEVLKVKDKARSDEIEELEVKSKARSDEIEVLWKEIDKLKDDNMKRTKREMETEAIRRLASRKCLTVMVLKDLIDAFGARQVKGKNAFYDTLKGSCVDDAYFLRLHHRRWVVWRSDLYFLQVGQKPIRNPTLLLGYSPKTTDPDSRVVLHTKYVRDFVQHALLNYSPTKRGQDSRAVLCTKMKLALDYLQQGPPEVMCGIWPILLEMTGW